MLHFPGTAVFPIHLFLNNNVTTKQLYMNRVQLVKTKDVFHAAGLEKLGILGMPLAWSVKSLTGLSKANKIYGQAFSKNQTEFLQFVLDTLQVD